MKRSPEIDQILKLMGEKDTFLITSHKDPDGDSIGSQIGLYLAFGRFWKESLHCKSGRHARKV